MPCRIPSARPWVGIFLIGLGPWWLACDSYIPTQPATSHPAPTRPTLGPRPVPGGPHVIEFVYDPDLFNEPAPQDADGTFVLLWDRTPYCMWLQNIPETPPDACRTYSAAFSLWPGDLRDIGRGCLSYPNQFGPGVCFDAPARNSVSSQQSIAITATERSLDGRTTEVFRRDVRIRFIEY